MSRSEKTGNSMSHNLGINSNYEIGRFYGNRNGEGKVIVSSSFIDIDGKYQIKEYTYFINKNNILNAVDGDLVLIDTDDKISSGSSCAKVVSVIGRDINYVVSEVIKVGFSYYLKPADKRLNNLSILLGKGVEEGQRVLVEINKPIGFNQYEGETVYSFKNCDDGEIDIYWEAAKCGIVSKFDDKAIEQASKMPTEVLDSDRVGRMDLTNWEIFTIDGDDTKDIDDALSCKKLENGNYLVGVHIADVSHYVKMGSPLDKDAAKRGTSVYLGGQVIPMLPRELSNGICSLNPNVERLAMSCIMEIDKKGNVVNYDIWKSIIKSNLKMTYNKVNNILKNGIIDEEYVTHANTIRELNKLALILRRKRIVNGSIEFDKPELRVKGVEGKDIVLSVRVPDVGENLVGEFMILANETIDKHLTDLGWPCLHRVHDKPNIDRLSEFLSMMNVIGISTDNYSADNCCEDPKLLQQLTDEIKKSGRLSEALSTNLVRCMSRAKYSPINIGHNGLAKANYCHFTSPIRRYPDLVVHRIVKDSLYAKKDTEQKKKKWNDTLSDIGRHSSKMERYADEAERSVLYLKCIQYMREHIGEDFNGVITGINDKGLTIQLDNYIEGKVKIASLPGKYEFDEATLSLLSYSGYDSYYIGDELSLKVIQASLEKKSIDFKVNGKVKEDIKSPKTLVKSKQNKK